MEPEYVLFIDDNFEPLRPILDIAAKAKGMKVLYASNLPDGFMELGNNSDNIRAVILDLLFADQPKQGEEGLKELRDQYPDIPIVVLTESYDNTAAAIRCIKNGAYDFMGKSTLDATHLFHVLSNAINQAKLKKRILQKPKTCSDSPTPAVLFRNENMSCQFAYKLYSIGLQTDLDLLDNLIRDSIRWHNNLLQVMVYSYRENVIPSLILVKHDGKSEIELYLIFSLYDSTKESVHELTNEFIIAVDPYVLSLHESHTFPYVFEPVTAEDKLQEILYPDFKLPSVRLYSEPICWGNSADYNLDMNDSEQPLYAEFLPKIYSTEYYSNYNLLIHALVSSTGSSHLCIHLQTLMLRHNEKEFLQKVINEDILAPSDVPEDIVAGCITRYKNIASSPADNYLFEVRFMSDIHNIIPKRLELEIKRYFYPERSNVKNTFQEGQFDNLFSIDRNRNLGRLSFTKASDEISFLFHLPVPLPKPIKGLPYQNVSIQIIPGNLSSTGLSLGEKSLGGEARPIRIDTESLKKHMYVLGQTGTGKTTLLKSMIHDALSANHGFCVIDPHGDLIEDVQAMIPATRKKDIVWFDTNNIEGSAKLNLLMPEISVQQSTLTDEIIRIIAFQYDYKNVGGPMFENYFKSVLNLVMHPSVVQQFSAPTLQLAYKALLIPAFLDYLLLIVDNNDPDIQKNDFSNENINDSEIQRIFNTALKSKGDLDWDTMRPYIYSKLKFFVDNVYIRKLFDSKEPNLNFRDIMDNGKILLVRLEKGHIGISNLGKIGMLFLNKLIFSIMSRTELPVDKRRDFFVFIDEFQNFMQGDIGIALSEVRKYNVGLVLANQTIGQLDDFLLQSVLGNVGSTVFFRTGINDIGKIRHFIEPEFTARQLINLQNFNCVARIMHNNRPSEPFIFQTKKIL